MALVDIVWIGGVPFSIQDEGVQGHLSPYDLDDNGALDERDALDCDPEDARLCDLDPAERNARILQTAMEEAGDASPPFEMLRELRDAYAEVARMHEVVLGLKALPHETNVFRIPNPVSPNMGFVEYEYGPSVWQGGVLPLIGGSTGSYREQFGRAGVGFGRFGEKYLDLKVPSYINVGSEHGTIANYPIWTQVDVGKVPSTLRPTVIEMTMMMSEVMSWHWREPGWPISQIECEGSGCPEDDESGQFYMSSIGANLCYVTDDKSDAHCFEGSFNPHIKYSGWCLGACFYAEDQRAGEGQIGFYPVWSTFDVFKRQRL